LKPLAQIALVAAFTAAVSASAAGPVPEFGGTWECRLPGAAPTTTPPIVWIQHARSSEPNKVIVEVDGFSRDMAGVGELELVEDGWSKITPERGSPFFLRPDQAPRGVASPAMELRRVEKGPTYQCLRLPPG